MLENNAKILNFHPKYPLVTKKKKKNILGGREKLTPLDKSHNLN